MTATRSRRGFTLVEVLVALIVLEIGVLGAVGLLTIAARTMARAEWLEAAAGRAEGVADSISAAAVLRDGADVATHGDVVSWSVLPDGTVRVAVQTSSAAGRDISLRARPFGGPGAY